MISQKIDKELFSDNDASKAELFAKGDIEGLEKVVHQSSKMIFWTSVPLIGLCFVFPEFLLSLFGEEFKIGVTAFIFLSCGRLVSSLSGSVGNILQMTGNQNIWDNIISWSNYECIFKFNINT